MMIAIIFMLGLTIGSFLNVVIYRTMEGGSLVYPPSHCPHCLNPLAWHHLIPVISFVALRGKCAFCKEDISRQYPLIEVLTGCLLVAGFLRYHLTFNFIYYAVLFSLLLVMSVIDIRTLSIYLCHLFICLVIGLGFILAKHLHGLPILDILVMDGILAVGLWLLQSKAKDKLGYGDVVLIPILCLFLEVSQLPIFLVSVGLTGGLIALALLAKGMTGKQPVPFVPILTIGFLLTVLSNCVLL